MSIRDRKKDKNIDNINNNLDVDSVKLNIDNTNIIDNINENDNVGILNNKTYQWHYSFEKILSELADEAQINAFLHKKSYEMFSYRNIKYQLPVIVLSALSLTTTPDKSLAFELMILFPHYFFH